MTTELRKPLLAACKHCRHVFVVCWTPYPAAQIVKALPRACPMCGRDGGHNLLMATKEHAGVYVDFLEREVVRARAELASLNLEEPTEGEAAGP